MSVYSGVSAWQCAGWTVRTMSSSSSAGGVASWGDRRSAIRGARTVSASSMIPTPITVRSTAGVARRGHATTDEIATHGLATTAAPTDSTVDIHRQKPVFRQH